MAVTTYGVNHPLAVKTWAKKLFVDALKETYFDRFMGEGTGSLVQVKTELQKGAGDQITVGLRMQLSGLGVQADGTLEGNEEALATYSDAVVINQIRHAVRSAGRMSEQRVPFSVREEARQGLRDWWADRLDTSLMNHLTGNSRVSDTRLTGNNATVAPDSSHRVWPSHMATGEESISTTDTFNLTMIDRAVELAKTSTPLIRPVRVNGSDFFVAFLHPYSVYSMRTSTTTGQWLDIQKAMLSANGSESNPIFSGALGIYNGVILHESTRIPTATASTGVEVTTCRRNVLCGAQSAVFAYGQDSSGGEMAWTEERFDYGNSLGVSAGMIFGVKKVRFNSLDFGTITIPSYSVAH